MSEWPSLPLIILKGKITAKPAVRRSKLYGKKVPFADIAVQFRERSQLAESRQSVKLVEVQV
jgi:hypothetical protein